MPWPVPEPARVTLEALRRQHALERELATDLRRAAAVERRRAYRRAYDLLYERMPALRRPADDAARAADLDLQAAAVAPFVSSETTFLEIGAGDLGLTKRLAGRVHRCLAVEPSGMAIPADGPRGVTRIDTDGVAVALGDSTIDVAYSCHVIEHLHPDDAAEHAAEVHRVLKPGGCYVCVTPNRLWGPHDVSRYFTDEPTGLHLREYTHFELARLLRRAGFAVSRRVRLVRGRSRTSPLAPTVTIERLLDRLPARARRLLLSRVLAAGRRQPLRTLEQVALVGRRG